jgi:transglutaminase-like putative cysteine protease
MTFEIYHKTTFKYNAMVTYSHNIARLKPRDEFGQTLLDFKMDILPDAEEVREHYDLFGNANHHLLVRKAHKTLEVVGRSKVQRDATILEEKQQGLATSMITVEEALRRMQQFHVFDLYAKRFVYPSELIAPASDALKQYALESFAPNRQLYDAGREFMQRIFEDFDFVPGFSDITTPVDQTFEARKGVCQDFAQLSISALRSLGLAACYVSGYIETIPPEGEEKLFGADASHAWFSLYIPGIGWADFDPTNNLVPSMQHIVMGYGRDYHDIAPLTGVVRSSGESHLSVMVDVKRLGDD